MSARPAAGLWRARLGMWVILASGLITSAWADPQPMSGTRPQDQACSAKLAPEPQPLALAGCTKAWCAGSTPDALCVCEHAGGGADRPRHTYRTVASTTPSRPVTVSPMLGPEAFSVRHADLDGDGVPDRIVEQRQAVSNGMGVAYASVCVWPSSAKKDQAFCRDVEDWGYLTRLVQEPGRQACSLIDAAWQPGRERGRGAGTYAIGRTWHLSASGWKPAPGRPTMSRRYTASFQRERDVTAVLPSPPLWYQNPEARQGQ